VSTYLVVAFTDSRRERRKARKVVPSLLRQYKTLLASRIDGAQGSIGALDQGQRVRNRRRAAKVDLLPEQSKSMSAEKMQSWQNKEADKRIASTALRGMNDKMLESWVEGYCADNTGDTLRDAGLAVFSELRQPK